MRLVVAFYEVPVFLVDGLEDLSGVVCLATSAGCCCDYWTAAEIMIAGLGELRPRVAETAFVAESALVAGDVEMGDQANVWYGCVIRGDVGSIRVGARSNIQDMSVLHVSRGGPACVVGDDVLVGHRAVLHGCTVEDGAFIGIGAVVLDGAKIGRNAMVGAGSVVPPGMDVPPGVLVMGTPAKVRRELTEEDIQRNQNQVRRYLETAEQHRELWKLPEAVRKP